jgi:hypothetical protein
LFNGRALAALRNGISAVRKRVASEGEQLTVAVFTGMIRDNHGKFVSSITTTDTSHNYQTGQYSLPVVVTDVSADTIVTTSLATYGPWLEGSGSRNETTRFKGYHGFRLAGQALNASATAIANEEIKPYVERMQ